MGLSGPRPPLTSLNSINSAEIVPQDPEANSSCQVCRVKRPLIKAYQLCSVDVRHTCERFSFEPRRQRRPTTTAAQDVAAAAEHEGKR